MGWLNQINSPKDLKKLSSDDLNRLAEEIRAKIIEVVFKNGGHLGSNLGVVELTLALHYVFDFETDRIIWDVSHQSYTHKLLTGRREQFEALRTFGGLSGFSNKSESIYDPFTIGHAGTSVSTALGITCADSLSDRSRKVVAVLGDGALTCGMTFEALNHAGALKKNLLIILNDNKMSISSTIGAMANYLNKLRMAPFYADVKKEVYSILDSLPVVGHHMERALDHLRASVVSTLGGFIFEELGFSYYGPLDGHNLPALIHILKEVRRFKRPVLIHVVTEKGRGSPLALNDPYRFHGIGPLKFTEEDKLSRVSGQPTYTEVFGQTVIELARKDKRLVTITAAMPEGTGLVEFEKTFPKRYFDVGICEQHAVGLAAGLAAGGLKPVVAVYSTFLQRAFDQLFQEIALQKSKVIFAMDRAGLVGSDGPTHHGIFDIAYARMFPGFVLMSPKDGQELAMMLEFAWGLDQPVVIRYPRATLPEKTLSSKPIQFGRAEIVKPGKDGVILAYGPLVYPALEAARILDKEGLQIMVVNARFAKPLDEVLLSRLGDGQPFLVTVEEHMLNGGFGSAVLESLSRLGKDIRKVLRLGLPDQFIEHGSRERLLKIVGLDAHSMAQAILLFQRSPHSSLSPGVKDYRQR